MKNKDDKLKILKKIQQQGCIKKNDFNKLLEIAISENEKEILNIKESTKKLYNQKKIEIDLDIFFKKIELLNKSL